MSGIVSQRVRSEEEEFATARNGNLLLPEGQRHDRVLGHDGAIMAAKSIPPDDGIAEIEITTGQKMLSAVSGSLLTSLLGETGLRKGKFTSIETITEISF